MKAIIGEIKSLYSVVKSFIVRAFQIFKDPTGKVSSKRVWAAACFAIAFDMLLHHDGLGFLTLIIAAVVLLVVAAITKS